MNDDTQMTINGNFVDVTKDFGGISLPSYKLVDIFFNRQFINDRLTIFGSITNIFNENYQEIAGFSTRGRNYKVGLNIKF
jgi:vitamin B12 transporter